VDYLLQCYSSPNHSYSSSSSSSSSRIIVDDTLVFGAERLQLVTRNRCTRITCTTRRIGSPDGRVWRPGQSETRNALGEYTVIGEFRVSDTRQKLVNHNVVVTRRQCRRRRVMWSTGCGSPKSFGLGAVPPIQIYISRWRPLLFFTI